ncbi:MAG: DNA-processing protein DprA [Chloroflexi bacterium]|nr:DNA-processing protein DprA [Chloroflexota bacterium]
MESQSVELPASLKHIIPKIKYLSAIGDSGLLNVPLFALFCSVKCPASIILKTYDLAQMLKDKHIGVISGFHSPVEKEVLVTLLHGDSAIVICPARSIQNMRVPADWKKRLEQQRLLIVSPFAENQPRATQEIAALRNQLVAALAQQVFIAYAEPGGKTETFARMLIAAGNPVTTFEAKETENLLIAGAKPLSL